MNWRRNELLGIVSPSNWLSENEARAINDHLSTFISRSQYGLDAARFEGIERLSAEAASSHWISRRVSSSESLFILFESQQACTLDSQTFVHRWDELFCPARDDVLIFPKPLRWLLYYCHEDFFEFGLIKQPT